MILGSGEPERINTRHEGAQLVLANGRIVELDTDAAKCLKGVQPGVNLPLMLDGRLMGVLGLTGDPQQVRTYGELVRMTAEMLLAQRHLQADQQWRRQRCDDLLALLLGGSGDSPGCSTRPGNWASSPSCRGYRACSSWPRGQPPKPWRHG